MRREIDTPSTFAGRRSDGGVTCLLCGATGVEVFFAVEGVPALAARLWRSREEARSCPRGNIQLAYCTTCGLIFNAAFCAELVAAYDDYENSLHFSGVFQGYAEGLARRLVERYGLFRKTVVEIGCGAGEFLEEICRQGENRGYGFDVARQPGKGGVGPGDVIFLQGDFSEAHGALAPDLICCRQVLEHVERPFTLVERARLALAAGAGGIAYFEVPNATRTFTESTWDIIYEHRSHFTSRSLAFLFALAGFDIIDLREKYEGQFLGVEARLAVGLGGNTEMASSPAGCGVGPAVLSGFPQAYARRLGRVRETLERALVKGMRVVLWGAGARAVSLLNAIGDEDLVPLVVDVNPRKHGRFLPGTGHQVLAPNALQEWQPDMILLVNPIYSAEVGRMAAGLGLSAAIECI
jgi:SAM-dependent methyltransferase